MLKMCIVLKMIVLCSSRKFLLLFLHCTTYNSQTSWKANSSQCIFLFLKALKWHQRPSYILIACSFPHENFHTNFKQQVFFAYPNCAMRTLQHFIRMYIKRWIFLHFWRHFDSINNCAIFKMHSQTRKVLARMKSAEVFWQNQYDLRNIWRWKCVKNRPTLLAKITR